MKTRFLFPYGFRYVGLALILLHIPIMLVQNSRHDLSGDQNVGTTLFTAEHIFLLTTALLVMIGLFLIAFSKEKIEDEQISQLRLDSLQWAVYLNYFILLVTAVLTNGSNFMHILQFNLWLPLLFFIIRFRWVIYRLNRSLSRHIS